MEAVAEKTLSPHDDLDRQLNRYHDRCDRCGSQAFVLVVLKSGSELMFCGHDYAKNEPALASSGLISVLIDQRHLINEAPSISANAE